MRLVVDMLTYQQQKCLDPSNHEPSILLHQNRVGYFSTPPFVCSDCHTRCHKVYQVTRREEDVVCDDCLDNPPPADGAVQDLASAARTVNEFREFVRATTAQ